MCLLCDGGEISLKRNNCFLKKKEMLMAVKILFNIKILSITKGSLGVGLRHLTLGT